MPVAAAPPRRSASPKDHDNADHDTAESGPPAPHAGPGDSAAQGCLQASLLLRRRIQRNHRAGMGEEQALLAVCGVLDALAHHSAVHPGAVPGPLAHAVGRLVDQLRRADPAARR